MSVTQLLFNTVHMFDGSVMRSIKKLPRQAWIRLWKSSNCPTCPLARSTVLFSPVTAYTKVSEASVAV
eukprot:2788247-Pleurochrysis_carterae.AAC.1